MSVPNNLKYIDTHEWVKVEGNEAIIGLTQHAVDLLGDVVYVELPAVGAEVSQNAAIGVVESVKAASDIYSPVSGKVLAVNDELANDAGQLNQDCYGKAWLYRVALSQPVEIEALLSAEQYAEFVS